MKKIISAITMFALAVIFIVSAWAADVGTVSVTEETFSLVKRIAFTWTTTSAGAASKTTTESYTGQAVMLITVPSGGGDAPTDNYYVTITDEDGLDVLAGGGATRDTANTEYVRETSLGWVANDTLTLTIASGGDTKSGHVYLYVR